MIHAKLVSFTGQGAQTAQRIAALLEDAHVEQYARTVDPSLAHTSLSRFAQQAMVDCDLIVFVGAAGIAVRAVAPYLAGKAFDPAVLVVDEAGGFVIPLLSGHLGGANALARRIAAQLNACAVITTATDSRNVFAVDVWAKAHGCVVTDPAQIKYVSGALLRGETVGLQAEFPVEGRLPARVDRYVQAESGFYVGFAVDARPFAHTLHLVPRIVHLGIGCRKGTPQNTIEDAVNAVLHDEGIPWQAVCAAATIDRKQDEPGLLLFCQKHGLPLHGFTAEVLAAAEGTFTASAFVEQTVGVENVCERAAAVSAGGGRLLRRKTAGHGVTVALAVQDWQVCFDQE